MGRDNVKQGAIHAGCKQKAVLKICVDGMAGTTAAALRKSSVALPRKPGSINCCTRETRNT